MNKLSPKVQNSELDGFASSVIKAYNEDAKVSKNAYVKKQMALLAEREKTLNIAILQNRAHSELGDLDEKRDSLFMNAKKMSEAYAIFPDAEKNALNEPLKALFDKYTKASLVNTNYKSESSLIASFKKDLEPYAENIASLDGMKESLERFFAAEDEFLDANKKYVDALNANASSASSFKKGLLEIINDRLVPYLIAMVLSEDEDCLEFAAFFDKEIDRTNAVVSKRAKKTPSVKN